MVSAGSGQNDHLSEIISHILEPIVKVNPGGMEVTSTGDFVSRINEVNSMNIPLEEVDMKEVDEELDRLEDEALQEIDKHLETQEKEAQERYDKFDDMMANGASKMNENLPDGWKGRDEEDSWWGAVWTLHQLSSLSPLVRIFQKDEKEKCKMNGK